MTSDINRRRAPDKTVNIRCGSLKVIVTLPSPAFQSGHDHCVQSFRIWVAFLFPGLRDHVHFLADCAGPGVHELFQAFLCVLRSHRPHHTPFRRACAATYQHLHIPPRSRSVICSIIAFIHSRLLFCLPVQHISVPSGRDSLSTRAAIDHVQKKLFPSNLSPHFRQPY